MFKNYLKIAYRNLIRYKGYSLINISGLAIGIACCIVILLWVQHELSYDRFHENADQIYRAAYRFKDGSAQGIHLPGPLCAFLKNNYPEIKDATTYKHWTKKISFNKKSFLGTGSYVDPSFFKIFTFPFVKGNPETALSQPYSIVITEDLAKRFFDNDDPLEKQLTYYAFSRGVDLKVTGVIKNIPRNSHIQFDYLIPYKIGYDWMKTWKNSSGYTYVLLHKNTSYQQVNQKISNVLNQHRPEYQTTLFLQPLKKIHLYPLEGVGRITYIYIFSVMGLLVLLIACINFMNLSTARYDKRFKEIAVKKVVGSRRIQLICQFLSESLLMSVLALFLAVFLVELLLPWINAMLGTQLNLNHSPIVILSLVGMMVFTGILAGSYPAFFLSSFPPAAVLKGKFSIMRVSGRKLGFSLRKALVVAQFTLSIFFVVCVMVIYHQLDYLKNRNLGFEKDNIVIVQSTGDLKKKNRVIKDELLKNPGIQSVAFSAFSLLDWESAESSIGVNWPGKTTGDNFIIGNNWVDYDYLKTFKMEMARGRFFSREFPGDVFKVCVLNEAAVRAMGLKDPVGKQIVWNLGSQHESTLTIIGVINDFNTQSLHCEIRPFLLRPIEGLHEYMSNYMCIRVQPGDISGSLRFIESKIKAFVPDDPFAYSFLDEELYRLYNDEQLTGKLSLYIAFLAIFISCLGLFGLAAFSAEQRRKEIGIRKVLGAPVGKLLVMLIKDFTRWVLIANIIAWPIAYYAMNQWLKDFYYRTDIGLWVFALSGLLALVIALVTVSYQSIRAATANPVETLRYE
jgi:putative ABC transport system permease protein